MRKFILLTDNLEYEKVIEIMRQHDPESKVGHSSYCMLVSKSGNGVEQVYAVVDNEEKERLDLHPVMFRVLDWTHFSTKDLCPSCGYDLSLQEEGRHDDCKRCGFTWGKFRGTNTRIGGWFEKKLG